MTDKKLLVLDLDETLIYATEGLLGRQADFEIGEYSVYRRPCVETFLKFCEVHFRVAIWTSSTASYAGPLVKALLPEPYHLEFLWARDKCVRVFDAEAHDHEWVKDLKKVKRLGFDLAGVIVVDDTPKKLRRNYGNLVRIAPFEGDPDDRHLEDLMPFLLELKALDDIRTVEKRGWLKRMRGE